MYYRGGIIERGDYRNMNESHLLKSCVGDHVKLPNDELALRLLLHATDCARGLGRDAWQFAVEVHEFNAVGVRSSELRRLVALGFVSHALERTDPRATERRFRRVKSLAFSPNSCFVLTEKGERHVRHDAIAAHLSAASNPEFHLTEKRHNGHAGVLKPNWNIDVRVLSVGTLVVKQFKRAAPHQELVIASFQELGWDRHIDDPIPQDKRVDPKGRLHDTIKKLNRDQVNPLIRFYGDGTGRGVCWELRTGNR
jgi:hypothetical protein